MCCHRLATNYYCEATSTTKKKEKAFFYSFFFFYFVEVPEFVKSDYMAHMKNKRTRGTPSLMRV